MAVNVPNYNGNTIPQLLTGTDVMQINEMDTITLSLTVTPGTNLGVHNNTATASGDSPANTTVTDDSQDGTNVDPTDGGGGGPDGDPTNDNDPTPVTFPENPEIGLAKSVIGIPTNNGDGTYTLSYQFLVKNTGDVPLYNVQVTDNLTTTFGGASVTVNSLTSPDMNVNSPAYNGISNFNLLAGSDNMQVGEQDTILLTITVAPTNLGPHNNSATAQGTSSGGTNVTDISHDGLQVDPENDGPGDNSDPTPVTFTENPIVGIAKTISTPAISNNDGTYTLTYQLLISNMGDVPLINVQITDDLTATFVGATSFTVDNVTSPDLSVNFPGYDGTAGSNLLSGTEGLNVGEENSVFITVTVTPGTKMGIYYNSATVNAQGTGGTPVSDVSYDGTNPDPDNNGDPTDNTLPTPVTFVENPQLGVAKVVTGVVDNMNGTFTVSYDIKIENVGDVPLTDIHVVDDLNDTYLNAASFSVIAISSADFTENTAYNGDTNIELLTGTTNLAVGASGIISISVLVNPGTYTKVFNNKAAAYGTSPAGTFVLDNSTDGTDVDPDGDGNPSNNSTPTPVQFPAPIIGASKAVSAGPTHQGDGSYMVTYQVGVKNFGAYNLFDVQLYDTLTAEFGTYVGATPSNAGEYTISTAPSIIYTETGSMLTANSSFTGSGSNTSLVALNTGDVLEVGDSLVVSFTIHFRPVAMKMIFENQVVAYGDQTENGVADGDATDLSDEGNVIDEDGDGIPTEDLNNVEDDSSENDPTFFSIDFEPVADRDDATTTPSTLVTIPILGNDTFGNDGPSTTTDVVITSPASNGTATVDNGGTPNDPTDDTIDYTPNAGFLGMDTLIYQICDVDNDCDTALVVITVSCPTLNLNTNMTDVTCNGGNDGAINLTVSGGSSPYTFNWSNGATSEDLSTLSTGIYTVTVTDNNACTGTISATVNEPSAITVSVSFTQPNCPSGSNDGTITITASGGSGSLEYSINGGSTYQAGNSFTDLASGSYTVQVRSTIGNCIETYGSNPVVLNTPSCTEICDDGIDNDGDSLTDCADPDCMPTISNVNVTQPDCPLINNGSIVITASGGSGSLQYSINGGSSYQASNSFSGLSGGNYNIQVRTTVGTCVAIYGSNPVILNTPTCTEICDDGIDNDGDSLVDCDDPDCQVSGISAGPDQELCATTTTTLNGSGLGAGETGQWTLVNGSGAVISSPNSSTTTISNLSSGQCYTFRWTVTTSAGCTDFDEVEVCLGTSVTAIAGADVDACGTNYTTISATPPSEGTGTWTLTMGSGLVFTSNAPNTLVYGLQNGTYEFTWTVTNGACTPASDTLILTVTDCPDVCDCGGITITKK